MLEERDNNSPDAEGFEPDLYNAGEIGDLSLDESAKNDNAKIEFTPDGETLGYISLDQARVLALRIAREDTQAYGGKYQNPGFA